MKFDTGLSPELLQEFYLVALDVFRQTPYPRGRSEQTAWLLLLTTENPEEAENLVREYPWLEEIYTEIAMLRQWPEEVLGMFSEALRILDENTAKLMIEELQKRVEEKDAEIEALKRQLKELSKKEY